MRCTAVAGVLMVLATAAALAIFGPGTSPLQDQLLFALGLLVILGVAALLVVRVPENRVSWVLLAVSWGIAMLGGSDIWVGVGIFALILPGLGVFLPLWFPTGRPPTETWRTVAWIGAAGIAAFVIGSILIALQGGDLSGTTTDCSTAGGCTQILGLVAILLAVAAAAASLGVRWRRSIGVERQQLKGFLFAMAVFAVGSYAEFGGFQYSIVANVLFPLGLLLIPTALIIAVLRYRLYEIDRIISRTVGYVLVVGLLGVVYAVVAVWLPSRLTGDSPVFVAGATLAVAALFNPLRRRVLRWVDRRFYRSRYDAERVVEEFSGRLRRETDVDRLTEDWVEVVTDTMQPSAIGVWVRE